MPEPVAEYFRMGGYAFYVWCSYAVVLVVLAFNLAAPAIRLRRVRRALVRQIRFTEDPATGQDGDDPLDADDPSGGLADTGTVSRAPAGADRRDDPRDEPPR